MKSKGIKTLENKFRYRCSVANHVYADYDTPEALKMHWKITGEMYSQKRLENCKYKVIIWNTEE
jgi:hypothetical protein